MLGMGVKGLVGLGEGFEGDGRDRDGWCWPDVITGWSFGRYFFIQSEWRDGGEEGIVLSD